MTNNIEEILTREEQLNELSKEQSKFADQYRTARVSYAKAYNYAKVQIAKRIDALQAKKKNVGIEMAEIMLMAEDVKTKEQWFIKACEKRDLMRAEYKGLAEVIDAIKSQKMSILGIMRNSTDGERYSQPENKR